MPADFEKKKKCELKEIMIFQEESKSGLGFFFLNREKVSIFFMNKNDRNVILFYYNSSIILVQATKKTFRQIP